MNELTIVMYHYVRPIKKSGYPQLKGLELDSFLRQLDYLYEEYNIVSQEDVLASIKYKKSLPSKACWLTFDDGYKDHYKYVLPALTNKGISAAFFPPRDAIIERDILDVNSVHFILSVCQNLENLIKNIHDYALESGLTQERIDEYRQIYCRPNRFDDGLTIYVKRLLQHVLPQALRGEIIKELFSEYIGKSNQEFSNELYMSLEEIKSLVKVGMHVGSHGSRHCWLDKISEEEQEEDISKSLSFLEEIGASTSDWVMCYPYGAYNANTLSIINRLGALAGVTTKVKLADLSSDNPLLLPRFDTNDFPT